MRKKLGAFESASFFFLLISLELLTSHFAVQDIDKVRPYYPDPLLTTKVTYSLFFTSRVSSQGHRIGVVFLSVCVCALSWLNCLTYDLDFLYNLCVSQSLSYD